jgi:predicted aspartyl protease
MAGRLVCPLVVSAVLCGASPSSAAPAEVPFTLFQQNLVVTKGSIGPLQGLNLLIDTGTIPSIIDARLAKKLGLQPTASRLTAFGQEVPIQAAVVDGIEIGGVRSGQIPAVVSDLSRVQGIRLDAIVGLDVLAQSNFSIDYRKQVITFAAVEGVRSAPMKVVWPFVTVQITIADKPVCVLVDTGSPDLVLFRSRLPPALEPLPWRGDKSVLSLSGPTRLVRIDLSRAALGADVWETLVAWSLDRSPADYPPEIDGVLGVRALGCQRVGFDFARGAFECSR